MVSVGQAGNSPQKDNSKKVSYTPKPREGWHAVKCAFGCENLQELADLLGYTWQNNVMKDRKGNVVEPKLGQTIFITQSDSPKTPAVSQQPKQTQQAQPAPQKSSTHTVKSGDTLEGIVIRFYGSYDASKIEKIMEANNLLNPNQLSIGQSLIIPLE